MVWQVWFNFFTVDCGASDSLKKLIFSGTLKWLELSSAAQRPCSENLSHLLCCIDVESTVCSRCPWVYAFFRCFFKCFHCVSL